MTRIHDGYLDCVVYLYASAYDAEEGQRTGGTGFLVSAPTSFGDHQVPFLYIVTNRHIVENGNSTVRIRDSSSSGHAIIEVDEREWEFHPKGDDVAICPFPFDPRIHKFRCVEIERFIDQNTIDSYDIGPGDDIFTIGRFINHEGRQRNLPTVRFGHIAQMPWEPIRQNHGFLQESFLVEARSIGGFSGAPVFAYIPPGSLRHGVEGWVDKILSGHGPWLLGVDWGHITDWEPVCDLLGRPINPREPNGMQVRINTGMMAVVPSWKIKDIFGTGPLIEKGARAIFDLARRLGAFPPTLK